MTKFCPNCVHFHGKSYVLWIIPIKSQHPFCDAVRGSQGEMEFAEIERHEMHKGDPHHCGPEGKFYNERTKP